MSKLAVLSSTVDLTYGLDDDTALLVQCSTKTSRNVIANFV